MPTGARFCSSCGHELVLVGDQRRIATVLFADLVGFTALSETLDPEQVKALVDRCFERLAADIEAFGGRVDKVVGDAIIGLFGAPVAHEDDAERAVRTGLRMQQTIAAVAGEIGHPVLLRVGINTGEVLVGSVQAGREYTAMGDVVNTASRLQTAADPGTVLVGPETYTATIGAIAYDAIEPVVAKGKELPVAAWVATGAVAPPGRRRRGVEAPLVGRETELALLNSVTSTAIDRSRASILIVHGEAGMGKSRLAAEAMRHAADELGALTLEGRCVPYGEANVWWPVADAIRSASAIEPDAPMEVVAERIHRMANHALRQTGRTAELERVVDGLLHLMGYDSLAGIDATRAREEAIRAVVAVVEGYTHRGPVLLVFSDMHWADAAVLDLADTLLARLARRPFVLLATARRALRDRWVPTPEAANVVALHLDPLDAEASGRLLVSLAGEDVESDLAGMLIDRAGGNPFYLEELVSLVRETGVRTLDELLETEAGELPSTLRGLVAARLDGLSPVDRGVLDDAAVLGRSNDIKALATMLQVKRGLGDEEARAHIENLAAREFFVIEGDTYTFRSEVIREVAYTTLTKADRARSHAGIAAWIAEFESSDKSDHLGAEFEHAVAHHYASAAELVGDIGPVRGVPGDVRERATGWLIRAIERAEREFLAGVVASVSQRAAALMDPDDPRRVDVLCRRARALAEQYRLVDADAVAAEARTAAESTGDPVSIARVQLVASVIAQHRGGGPVAHTAARAAYDGFVAAGDLQGRADALRQIGLNHLLGADAVGAEQALLDARTAYEQLGDERGVAWAQQHLSWSAFVMGAIDLAEERVEKAMTTFADLGDPGGLTWTRGLLAWVRFHQGRDDEAADLAAEVEIEARDAGERWGEAMMVVLQGVMKMWTGRSQEAVDTLVRATQLFSGLEEQFGSFQARGNLARSRAMAGDVSGGLSDLDIARRFADDHRMTVEQRWLIPLVALGIATQVGDTELAAAALDEVGMADEDPHLGTTDWQVSLALGSLQAGDVDRAGRALDRVAEARGYVDAVRALFAVRCGDPEGALAHAERLCEHPRTYLDDTVADIARSLAHVVGGRPDEAMAVLSNRIAVIEDTDDLVARAVVRLVAARVAIHLGRPDASAALQAADQALAAAGIDAGGWRDLVSDTLAATAAGRPVDQTS